MFTSRWPQESANKNQKILKPRIWRQAKMILEPPDNSGDCSPSGDSLMDFERFSRRLIGLARKQLGGQLQYKVDPEDVVQSAYKSLLLRYGDGALAAEGWNGLWGLLTTITVRKCADRARFFQAERRDTRREAAVDAQDIAAWGGAIDREPTPDEAVALAEVIEGLFAKLEPDERTMFEMSLQGFTTQEISEKTGRAERSVRRLRERIRKYLERERSETE
jgi:RNA polymerase sigma-70 factor (ECF subfamily)